MTTATIRLNEENESEIMFSGSLDPMECEFIRSYLEENDNRECIEMGHHFAHYYEAWAMTGRLCYFYICNENQNCVAFNLEMVESEDRFAFFKTVCDGLEAMKNLPY